MKIRVLGGGWYGCHLTMALLKAGHEVELHETADQIFSGASGGNPARLHLGPHYPRSKLTRALCQEHHAKFMAVYGFLTRSVPVNIYAIADADSLVDFGTYVDTLRREIEFIVIERPEEYGLQSVEGAILVGERHIVIREARDYFATALKPVIRYRALSDPQADLQDSRWDWTLDCTFCANDAVGIERYEPCVTGLLHGPVDRAVTVMDGPFPSLYPWDERDSLNSLTSARYTPLGRYATHSEARAVLATIGVAEVRDRVRDMYAQLAAYWPQVRETYVIADHKLTIRAMPRSGAAARLIDVIRVGERGLRIRAGKIDAILHAEQIVREMING